MSTQRYILYISRDDSKVYTIVHVLVDKAASADGLIIGVRSCLLDAPHRRFRLPSVDVHLQSIITVRRSLEREVARLRAMELEITGGRETEGMAGPISAARAGPTEVQSGLSAGTDAAPMGEGPVTGQSGGSGPGNKQSKSIATACVCVAYTLQARGDLRPCRVTGCCIHAGRSPVMTDDTRQVTGCRIQPLCLKRGEGQSDLTRSTHVAPPPQGLSSPFPSTGNARGMIGLRSGPQDLRVRRHPCHLPGRRVMMMMRRTRREW
jgi:hypothetical protein